MIIDQIWYNLLKSTPHLYDINYELFQLKQILEKNEVSVTSAIDIACGDGNVSIKLMEVLKLKQIIGNDINENLLSKARKRGIRTINEDMNHIKISRKVDISIIYGSLHHSCDKVATLRSLCNLSKKYILIVDSTVRDILWHKITNNNFYRFDTTKWPIWKAEDIISALRALNIWVIDTKTMYNLNIFHDRSIILAKVK